MSEADHPEEAAPAGPEAPVKDPAFEELWKRVLEAWDDDKTHGAMLEYALRTEQLADVAGRYRAIKEKDPSKAEKAQKRLDAIVIAATQLMMSMKTPQSTKVPLPITLSAAGIFIVTLAFLAWILLQK